MLLKVNEPLLFGPYNSIRHPMWFFSNTSNLPLSSYSIIPVCIMFWCPSSKYSRSVQLICQIYANKVSMIILTMHLLLVLCSHVFNFQSIFHSTSVKVTRQFSHIHKIPFNCYMESFMPLTFTKLILMSMYLLSSMPHVVDNCYNCNIIHKISILSPKYWW
jgi:hypothetical protein